MSVNFMCKFVNGKIVNDELCLENKLSKNNIVVLFRNWLSMISGLYQIKITSSEYKIK